MDGNDPLNVLLPWLNRGGVTNYKATNHYLWAFYAFHMASLLFIHIVASFMNVPVAEDFWNDGMESLQFGISATHLLTKQISFILNRDRYAEFLRKIEEVWTECWDDPGNREILKEGKRRSDNWTNGLLVVFLGGIFTQNTFTALSNWLHSTQKLPFQMYTPDIFGSFWSRILIQAWIMIGPAMGDAGCCAFYKVSSVLISTLMVIVKKRLQRDADQRNTFALHRKISILINEINELHSGQIAFEVVMTSLIICIRGYACMKALAKHDPRVLGYVYILFLCLISTYLICANGTLIAHQSKKIHFAAYEGSWYKKDLHLKKDYCFFLLITTNDLSLNYKKILVFDMVRFGIVLQGTYSYLTILRFFDTT